MIRPKATTTAKLHPGRREVVHVVGDRDAELGGRLLDRARRRLRAAAAPAIGPGYAEGDVVAGLDECAQRWDGQFGGAEVRQAGHPLTVGQRR